MTTHRMAIDDIAEGISTSYCGVEFSLYDEAFKAQDPTCSGCRASMIEDRKGSTKPRPDDPLWLQQMVENGELNLEE